VEAQPGVEAYHQSSIASWPIWQYDKSEVPDRFRRAEEFRQRGQCQDKRDYESKGNAKKMWKPTQSGNSSPNPEPVRPAVPATPNYEPTGATRPAATAVPAAAEQATIGKSLVVKGEVTGSESLYIDGKVEGAINLPGNRVTVGRNGQVAANITAREIVVLGKVRGNVNASDRVDIRSEGSLIGDVVAQRISIEDGAFFKGGIDIRKPGGKEGTPAPTVNAIPEPAKTAVTV